MDNPDIMHEAGNALSEVPLVGWWVSTARPTRRISLRRFYDVRYFVDCLDSNNKIKNCFIWCV